MTIWEYKKPKNKTKQEIKKNEIYYIIILS